MPKKRILSEITLTKIAAVDLPCQEHAEALLIKNRDSGAEPDRTDNEGVNMSEINKALGLPEKATEAEGVAKVAEINKALETAQQAFTASEEKVATLTKAAEDAEIAKRAADTDEAFTNMDGDVIKKSAVGDVSFKMLKGMNDRLVTADIEKSISTDYANLSKDTNLPGILKFARTASTDVRDGLAAMVKQLNELTGLAITKNGRKTTEADDKVDDPDAQLEKMAKAHQKANPSLTFAKAYTEILKTDAGQELYAQRPIDTVQS